MFKKETTASFIDKARKIHGDKYDYTNVDYHYAKEEVCIVCPIHGKFYQTPHKHLSGSGCPECGKERRIQKRRSTRDEFITKAKEVHGDKYIYDNVVYVNSQTPVDIICPKHGIFAQKPNAHLRGHGCPFCGGKLLSNTEEFIRKARKVHGDKYQYDKVDYVNVFTKVWITCPIHGDFQQTPNEHLNGYGCPLCGIEKTKNALSSTREEFITKANQVHNGKFTYDHVEYVNETTPVWITCTKHGDFLQTPHAHLKGHGCPRCANNNSKPEQEISKFIEGLGLKVQRNTRKVLANKYELDIYVPDKKIAIEYDGLFWHSEDNGKGKKYHLQKTQECEEQGIQLIHIFEDEWNAKRDIVLSRLKNILGTNQHHVFARNCIVKEIDNGIGREFINLYHIQGQCNAKVYLGLYHDDELLSVMSFGNPRQKRAYPDAWELLRFCSKADVSVVGGASKLLHHFINSYKPMTILSYADRRWSNGNLYRQLGFSFLHNSEPNYFYVIGGERRYRFEFRKAELVKQGYDSNLSEKEIMQQRGIPRIYDCGNMVFKMDCCELISERL